MPSNREKIIDNIIKKLGKSTFRASFFLCDNDVQYVRDKGFDVITKHAYDFINKNLKSANNPKDGKQTPMRGHPVFIAQHATATCCRGCLEKWHGIPRNRDLKQSEVNYIVYLIVYWINLQIKNHHLVR